VRLAPPRLGRGKPFRRQSELVLEFEVVLQPGPIVRGQRDDQRAFAAEVDRHATRALEFRGELRPQRLAGAVEREQLFLARFHLGTGREHSGRGVACALPGFVALEQRHRNAALREPPADRKAGDAGANDDDARLSVRHRLFPPLALPRQVQWV
jgi:hypothetical protein